MRKLGLVGTAAVFLAAQATSAQQEAAAAQPEPALRYRALPPYADPGFVSGPVPPPAGKNYLAALGEVVFIDAAIWGYDYLADKPYAKISLDSISNNFHKGWIVDTDDFWANQLMHPVHGNLTFNAGRAFGLNFYESFVGSFIGSVIWEQFAEIQPPSMNDQVNTPFGGTLLGETMFRMSRLILDSGGYKPGFWREFFAFAVNPVGGVDRLLVGDKYRGALLLPPSWNGEFHFGSIIAGSDKIGAGGERSVAVGPWASIGADIVYGVPGTPELSLKNPFDHFTFSGSLSLTSSVTGKATSSLLIRGLLLGDTLSAADGGLWGLFASYDFIAPEIFRVGGVGFGPGLSLVKRWGSFELTSTLVGELMPWASGGSTIPLGVRDYHSGVGADVVAELRGQFGDRVTVRLEGREYWVSGSYASGQSENISYVKGQVTVRVYDVHGVTGILDFGHRQASYPYEPDVWDRASTGAIYYTLLQGW